VARARLALSLLVGAAFFATVPGTLAATPAPTDGKEGALWQQFAAKVGAIEAQTDGVLGVAVMDLKSGHEWSLRGHERFPQASTIKIAVLAELLRQDEAGDGAHLSDRYVVDAADIVAGSDILEGLTPGVTTLTNRDLATCMVAVSDNSATNVLINRLGMARINALLDKLGLNETRLKRKMLDLEAAKAGRENVSTPLEMAALLTYLWRADGTVLKPEATKRFFDLLSTHKDSQIPSGLPAELRIANKPGALEGVRNDAGIVFLPRHPYVIVVMGTYLRREGDGEEAIRRISRAAFDLFDRLDRASDLGRVISPSDGSVR
jgi:beta-lactamase class A